jgi:hypothetical protein
MRKVFSIVISIFLSYTSSAWCYPGYFAQDFKPNDIQIMPRIANDFFSWQQLQGFGERCRGGIVTI